MNGQRFGLNKVLSSLLALGLMVGVGLATPVATAAEMGKEEAVQVAKSAVARARAAAAQARVAVKRIATQMHRFRLAEVQQAQQRAEAQVRLAMDAQQRAIMAPTDGVAQAAATAA